MYPGARKRMGNNFSIQKKLIAEALQRLDHPTAAEIHQEVAKTYAGISLGTVYRNINHMLEAGTAGRLVLPGEPDRFESHNQPHAHILCSGCDRLRDFEPLPDETLRAISQRLTEQIEFYVNTYSLVFSECAPNAEKRQTHSGSG